MALVAFFKVKKKLWKRQKGDICEVEEINYEKENNFL